MVRYIFCENCGKVIDEYENCCYWCGLEANLESEDKENESNNDN